ncbi:unnamed protein product [Vitrella brassicaformis CCMP3155]|uniref:F-box domain-containing protein n=1 Tax=Vitrella brassicaformis (strain CCMP3155) TaxID=1169540 RepID=A0A0G4GQU6_VITBC|nr:unnamed protein product [Vitrella brassicaformis CCMP3155]|eukprot:CEM32834.1 unnamed protein product [Vitrella brassicaformis CCMP3155]
MADGGLMDLDKHDGPAASAAAGGQGRGGSRDLLQKIRSMRSSLPQLASDLERAEDIIAIHTDNDTQDGGASLAGRLSAYLRTLSDVQSALRKDMAHTTDHNTKRNDHTDADTQQHSKEVAVGEDGKRERVDALADASSGGGPVGACGAAAATQQQGVPLEVTEKGHGRPCLPGLPAAVIGQLGSFLTTINNVRSLTRVNRETHMKATDKIYGVFRTFTMTRDEEPTYREIKTLKHLKDEAKTLTKALETTLGLFGKFAGVSVVENAYKVKKMPHMPGNVKTAFVEVSSLHMMPPVVSELLEANKDTLKKMTLDVEANKDTLKKMTLDVEYCARAPDAEPIVFSKVTHMDIRGREDLKFIGARCWTFPALTTLRLGRIYCIRYSEDAASLVRLLNQSPKLERLEVDRIRVDDGQWADFTAALGRCPSLTTITALVIDIPSQFGRLNQLKAALKSHWDKPEKKEVRKKLGFVVPNTSIGVGYGQQGMANMEAFRRWAADAKCEVDWQPAGRRANMLVIDCSSGAATALPAPSGLCGQIATRMAANATEVRLELGGTALHESWRDKLIFTNTKKLTINKRGASASAVVDSIPTWLTERQGEGEGQGPTSRCFPAVEELKMCCPSLSMADVYAVSRHHTPFLGGLRTLKSVTFSFVSSLAAAHEFLCCLSVEQLDEVTIEKCAGREVCEWPADPPATGGVRHPLVHRLVCRGLSDKAGLTDSIKLAPVLRPARVELEAWLRESELEGDTVANKLADLRSFAAECAGRVASHYTVKKSECVHGVWDYCLKLNLAA